MCLSLQSVTTSGLTLQPQHLALSIRITTTRVSPVVVLVVLVVVVVGAHYHIWQCVWNVFWLRTWQTLSMIGLWEFTSSYLMSPSFRLRAVPMVEKAAVVLMLAWDRVSWVFLYLKHGRGQRADGWVPIEEEIAWHEKQEIHVQQKVWKVKRGEVKSNSFYHNRQKT